jgi:hypothetical protein
MARKKERRSGVDRRQKDFKPPGGIEKRKKVEARKPEIVEVELSEAEWKRHFGNNNVAEPKLKTTIPFEASEVLGRARK